MNTKALITTKQFSLNGECETLILTKDAELKELARKTGRHFAEMQQPLPSYEEDSLIPFIGPIKAGYEELAAKLQQIFNPASHLPEGKVEADYAEQRGKQLDEEKTRLFKENKDDNDRLGSVDPPSTLGRARNVMLLLIALGIAETALNAQAFQVLTSSLLMAVILSIGLGLGIYVMAHFIARQYKKMETTRAKHILILSTALGMTIVFYGLGILRSAFLSSSGVDIPPVVFVVINLFFFAVAALVSYHYHPAMEEIRAAKNGIGIYRRIKERNKKIERIDKEKNVLSQTTKEKLKGNIRTPVFNAYVMERIKKLYAEAIEIFKQTNLMSRSDGRVPKCFSMLLPELEISIISFYETIKQYQQ